MNSYIIHIERFEELKKTQSRLQFRELVRQVRTGSKTVNNKIITPNNKYFLAMPNSVHQFFLSEKNWRFIALKAVSNCFKKDENWINFGFFESFETAARYRISTLESDICRNRMYIDRNQEAINRLKSELEKYRA